MKLGTYEISQCGRKDAHAAECPTSRISAPIHEASKGAHVDQEQSSKSTATNRFMALILHHRPSLRPTYGRYKTSGIRPHRYQSISCRPSRPVVLGQHPSPSIPTCHPPLTPVPALPNPPLTRQRPYSLQPALITVYV